MKKLRNVVVACDYAYVEGGAAGMAVLTAVLLSRQTDYNVYFLGGCGEAAQELKDSRVKCVLLGLPDLLQNPSKADAFLHGIYNRNVYRKAACAHLDKGTDERGLQSREGLRDPGVPDDP